MATRLGKPHSFVSKCELGERRVDFVELQQFAKIYGKEFSFFSGDLTLTVAPVAPFSIFDWASRKAEVRHGDCDRWMSSAGKRRHCMSYKGTSIVSVA